MTFFRRRGHWRTNSNGTTFWVRKHGVNRDDRGTFTCSSIDKTTHSFNTIKAKFYDYSYSSFVNPNATCPVCGNSVFYYESRYGGKVYFDSLGPPWPKHLCTNNIDITTIKKNISQYKSWMLCSWQPFQIEMIEELQNNFSKVTGTILSNEKQQVFYLKKNYGTPKKLYENICHIKILHNQTIIVSTFEISTTKNNVVEILFNGNILIPTVENCIKETGNKKYINIWVNLQLSKLNKNFKRLSHLVKYKGVHEMVVKYFSNIYLGIHEEWMQQLMKEYDLPYPKPPPIDWFEKLKKEQELLEEKWRRDSR
ncbi:hypothetical protein GF1_16670 [Desulfolithobacter dissulfuricans]|uniref:Uncharacterized protein n=1 Tax=Desulfolithobacter dissulfuricans TaxID=2795293 RepID=A0A915U9U2_9BACT|nr:hypothetical protein [Desulfolithobacter dissulfuricans]BCO09291.1 hypothetical protein GF1_16670 [Desulfolithobacter dissulfuricans]